MRFLVQTPGTGAFSCFRKEEEKKIPGEDDIDFSCRIQKFYEEAASRLPLDAMPELEGCIYAGGNSLGLVDPVSNIILNSIGLLNHDEQAQAKRPAPLKMTRTSKGSYDAAFRTLRGLEVFMVAYFRHLSAVQARRYLDTASHDLRLAVKLVHHDRFSASLDRRNVLLPDGGKIKAALRLAAVKAEHPVPDVLVRIMTAQYPEDVLFKVLDLLRIYPLRVQDVSEISYLLGLQWPPTVYNPPCKMQFCCRPHDTTRCIWRDDGTLQVWTYIGGDNMVAEITIRRQEPSHHRFISDYELYEEHLEQQLHFHIAGIETARLRERDDEHCSDYYPCAHIESLKMCLLDTIHVFYIKALARMPNEPRLLRALLTAGHCYGPFSPSSNIIINSIWYDIAFPPAAATEGELPRGILDTRYMSRLEYRSLDGILSILECDYSTQHQALNYLNTFDCNIFGPHSKFSANNWDVFNQIPFDYVAKAAKHPQHAAFGSFLMSLSPDNIKELNDLLSPEEEALDHKLESIVATIRMKVLPQKENEASCDLSSLALLHMPRKKSDYLNKLTIVHCNLNTVLREYCNQHPWEPNYQVDIICGVWQSSSIHYHPNVYHANFLAKVGDDCKCCPRLIHGARTLFFAEFWVPPFPEDVKSKPSSCYPIHNYGICDGARNGRCSFCEMDASTIIHPPCGSHSGDIDGSADLYSCAVRKVSEVGFEGVLDADFIYVDPKRDVELVETINRFRDYAYDMPMTSWKDLVAPSIKWAQSDTSQFWSLPSSGVVSRHGTS